MSFASTRRHVCKRAAFFLVCTRRQIVSAGTCADNRDIALGVLNIAIC